MSADAPVPDSFIESGPSHRLVCRTDDADENTLVAIDTENVSIAVWVDGDLEADIEDVFDSLQKEIEHETALGGRE